jgi:hypothetical protein
MGCGISKVHDEIVIKGAGCIFTNGKLILAGYQPYKKVPVISGIGGSCNSGEDYIDTAHRELLEELFGFEGDLTNLIMLVKNTVSSSKYITDGPYINLVYNFDDLSAILVLLNKQSAHSKFYDKFPQCIEDLLLKRKLIQGAEIQHLILLPVIQNLPIADEFIKDIRVLVYKVN